MQQQNHYLKQELDQLIQQDTRIFQFIQQSSLDGIWYWDLEKPQHEWMSEKFWTTLGYAPSKMPHDPAAWKDIIFAEDAAAAEQKIQKHLANPQTPYDQLLRYRHASGTTVWVRCRGLAIRDDKGKPTRMLGTHTDITEIKRKEEELQAFLDEAHDLIQSVDQQGDYVYVNRAWSQTLGYSREEALGLSMFNVIDPEYIPHCQKMFRTLLKEQKTVFINVVLRSKAGKAVRAEGNVGVYQQADGRLVTRAILRDVTLRYEAQQALSRTKELLEQTSKIARVGGWEIDLETGQVHWTEMTKEIFEVDADFVPDQGSGFEFCKEGRFRDAVQQLTERAILEGTAFDEELQIVTARGHERWVRIIGHAERRQERTIRLYGTVQDVEAQKQAKEKLVQATEEARSASRAKSEFLANMSHEIRTPLNGVIGFTDLLMKTRMDDTQQQYMHTIHYSAHALMELINDILDFSKIEAGRMEISKETTDLWQFFAQISDIVKPHLSDKDIELLFNIDPQLPQYARVDPIRLRQIMINLLGNAIKFTESGEIEVLVERIVKQQDDQSAAYRFVVRDTGVGIDPKRQEAIFHAFSQEDSSTSRKYGGTGLGLAITNQLLKLMGSQLELTSTLGKGSTFSFHLRLEVEDTDPNSPKINVPIHRVLVVDDHEKNCEIIRDSLSLLNIQADMAYNGIEALQKLEQQAYDAMIVDYYMPFMDGLQVIQKIRETMQLDSRKLPIVLLHSSTEDNKINEMRRILGIQQVVSKPITFERLKFVLQNLYVDSSERKESAQFTSPPDVCQGGLSLLLVDDNPMNRKLAQAMVKQILPEIDITEAENGQEAVSAFERYQPDIILMDIQMPLLNGYEASRKIRTLPGGDNTRIIALTASAIKGEKERCLEAGMNDYMTKPVVMEVLNQHLNSCLKRPQEKETENLSDTVMEDVHFSLSKFKENAQLHDDDIIAEMVALLHQQLTDDVPRLKKAFLDADYAQLKNLAHKHKASTATAGMPYLSEMLANLEGACKKDEQPARVEELVGQIQQEFILVNAELTQHFPELSMVE